MSIEKTLKGLQDNWDEAEEREPSSGGKLPDGDYVFNLVGASVEESKSSDRPQVVWSLKVVEPDKFEGRETRKFDGIDTAIGMGWLKGLLKLLGIDVPKKVSNLPEAFEEFFSEHKKGVLVNGSVVTSGDYTNMYINSLVNGSAGNDAEPKKKDKGKDDGDDLDNMNMKQLKAYVKENDVDVDVTDYDDEEDLVKAIKKVQSKKKDKKKSKFAD